MKPTRTTQWQTFTDFLGHQIERLGPVGDIAREVEEDPNWPAYVRTIDGLHDYLNTHTHHDAAHVALDMAWDEYQKETKRAASRP